MSVRYRLKKDIVIPAGTVFGQAPTKKVMNGPHIEHILGLTKDTSGSLIYALDDDPSLDEWFEKPCP